MTAAAWTSFVTGKNPGKHGLFDFVKRSSGEYRPIPVTSRDRRAEPIWSILGRAGYRVGIVNVPMTYPPERVNGFMVSGFPTPPGKSDFTYPRSLFTQLKAEIPDFRLQKTKLLTTEGLEEHVYRDICEVTESQTRVLTYLMGNNEWDLLMTVYDGPDVAGHHFWRFTDPEHPEYNPGLARIHGDKMNRVYETLDASIKRLISLAGDDVLTIVCSDHGFCPVYYCVCFNSWLIKTGLMQLKPDVRTRMKYALYKLGLNNYNLHRLVSKVRMARGADFVYQEKSKIMSIARQFTISLSDVDWTRTVAYSFGNFGPIFVNLRGREPNGIVPEEQYNKVLGRVEEEARNLQDPFTGKRIFENLIRGKDVYTGPYAADGPDLMLFDSKMVYRAQRMFEFGTERLVTPHPIYSGSHDFDGIFIAQGDVIRRDGETGPYNIIDVAPTLLHAMGLQVPDDMDGRILDEILSVPTAPAARARPSERARIMEELEQILG